DDAKSLLKKLQRYADGTSLSFDDLRGTKVETLLRQIEDGNDPLGRMRIKAAIVDGRRRLPAVTPVEARRLRLATCVLPSLLKPIDRRETKNARRSVLL